MDLLEAQANTLFPGSTTVSRDSYDLSRQRLLEFIKSLKCWMPDEVDRWKLACLACEETTNYPGDHARWAQQMLETDLTQMLAKLHASEKALDCHSTDPELWETTPNFTLSTKMPEMERKLFLQNLGLE